MDLEGKALTMWAIEDVWPDGTKYIECDVWAARKLAAMDDSSCYVKWSDKLVLAVLNPLTGEGIMVHVEPDSDLLFCDDEQVVLRTICNYSRTC